MPVEILVGDACARLAEIPDESVHCVVTSPPYFGLRDYEVPVTVWGGVPGCNHDWCDATVIDRRHLPEAAPSGKQSTNAGSNQRGIRPGDLCSCGAWRGSLGLEPTPDLFVAHLVDVFRQVRRVLRADGTLWLNIGDSYAGSWGAQGRRETEALELSWHGSQINNHPKRASNTGSIRSAGVKPKDLYGIPWLLAFALRADGWWLRQEVIWSKPNPMPESITDRCTKSHESLFLLTKSERYFYDQVAILEPASPNTHARLSQNVRAQIGSDRAHAGGKTNGRMKAVGRKMAPAGSGIKNNTSMDAALALMFDDRNKRSVWSINTAGYAGAHFAVMPPALVEPCILAGTSAKGSCAACGAPVVRQVEKTRTRDGKPLIGTWDINAGGVRLGATGVGHWRDKTKTETIGWEPSCGCDAGLVPALVLDPFGGAGTVGLVADRLQRNAILIELNQEYAAMARDRIADEAGNLFGDPVTVR